MNKIGFPRTSVDGRDWTQVEIEDWFYKEVSKVVTSRIRVIHSDYPDEESFIRYIENHLRRFILARPIELSFWVKYIDTKLPITFVEPDGSMSELGLSIIDAFKYEAFRDDLLVELAKRLNVKTCPYCNMHYTLYAEENGKGLTKFQFDHFFDKKEYPVLSMSLYNLIPSCSVCNHSKLTSHLSFEYNPYHSDIQSKFRFEVADPTDLYVEKRITDETEILLIPNPSINKKDFDDYSATYHLCALYKRQGDLAQEIFDKAYQDPFYLEPDNFSFLGPRGGEYIKRLWMGTYPNAKDIEKRPMTKFIQDLWQQAIHRKELDDDAKSSFPF